MKRELGLLLSLAVAAGCGAKGNSCVPGMSAACVCSDGSGGAQVCRGDGTFGACACGTVGVGGNGNGNSNGNGGSVGDMATGGGGSGGGGGTGGAGGGGGGGSTGSKRVFVTSTVYSPTVAAGICNTVAQAASLSGTWVPWLSNASTQPMVNAIDAVKGTGPWLLLDGSEAFANHAQLATAPTQAIVLTEKMTKLTASDGAVWTGTANGGVRSGADCDDWSTIVGTYDATVGQATIAAQWTSSNASTNYNCSANAHVYCFEQ